MARRFPHDMLHWLEMLGRYGLDGNESGVDLTEIYPHAVQPFLWDATDDRVGFEAALRALVVADRGGLATYGASQLVLEIHGNYRSAEAEAILDAGLEVKRRFGLSWHHLTGYESARWTATQGATTWPGQSPV